MTPHGSRTTYIHKKCRCGPCRAANAEYQRGAIIRRSKVRPLPLSVRHGSLYTYINWACRCPHCTAANREHSADMRARKEAKASE